MTERPDVAPPKEVEDFKVLGSVYHLIPTEKTREMDRWDELKSGPRGLGGHGYPDDLIIPLCDEINNLSHVCTLQSCAGHKARENEGEYPGNLWLWFTRPAFGRLIVCADAAALSPGITDVRILYRRYNDARAVVEVLFDGHNKSAEAFSRSAENIMRLIKEVMPDGTRHRMPVHVMPCKNTDVTGAPSEPPSDNVTKVADGVVVARINEAYAEGWCDAMKYAANAPPPSDAAPVAKGREHELKVWPPYFEAVACGEKTFEIRKNDRLFRGGDTLWLREWNPKTSRYTGRECHRLVTFVYDGRPAHLEAGYCIMGLAHPEDAPEGPWRISGAGTVWSVEKITDGDTQRVVPLHSKSEAIAVRDVLNRLKGDET